MTLNAVCGIYFTSKRAQNFSAAAPGRSFFFHHCVLVSHGSSLLTPPSRINSPIPTCVPSRSGSRSNDRILITRDSYFRWGIFARQPAPSAFFSISICHPSIVFYHCFLAPSFILPNAARLSVIVSWKTRDWQ